MKLQPQAYSFLLSILSKKKKDEDAHSFLYRVNALLAAAKVICQ